MSAEVQPAGPGRPWRVPAALADPLLRELGAWLEGAGPTAEALAVASDRRQDGRLWRSVRRLIGAHGLAPFLARDPAAAGVVAKLPDELRGWLAEQDELNRARIGRLLDELAAALRAFAAAGLTVMPLKGAVLATRPGSDPFRRPMADLDLLVRPGDREAAMTTLESLGYRWRPEGNRRPTHATFELPGNDRVVSVDGEHPDNPRRIELHTEVKRHLWAWADDDDLTAYLWAGAAEATVLGAPAILPSAPALAAHLAIHATSDLLLGRGRLGQWLDLAEVAAFDATVAATPAAAADDSDRPTATPGDGPPHPRLMYPALRLAARRLPARFSPAARAGLEALEARVPERLVAWAAGVPLDTRAGLQAGRFAPGEVSTLAARWSRWAPFRWRLVVAHGDVPLPVAALRHAARVASMARRRP